MDKWKKDDFLKKISDQETQLGFYEKKLRDLVAAYKGLSKEKDSLDQSFSALKNMCELKQGNPEDNDGKSETFKDELGTLMNSLATLSAEKSRMEASFQSDKKLLRLDMEQQERTIKDLRDKVKRLSKENTVELEQYKSLLIIEKHEREKEQNNHGVMIRELQQLLQQERNRSEELRNLLSKLENENTSEKIVPKPSPKRMEENAWLHQLEVERRRATRAEQLINEQASAHEARVAVLETRLAELSQTVAMHHHLRQQDQNHIIQLKAKVAELSVAAHAPTEDASSRTKTSADVNNYIKSLLDKIIEYKTLVTVANEQCDKPIDIHNIICDLCCKTNVEQSSVPKDEHTRVLAELDFVRHELNKQTEIVHVNNKEDALKLQIKVLQDQNSVLNDHIQRTVNKYENNIDIIQKQYQADTQKLKDELKTVSEENKMQLLNLDQQIRKQRERTLQLLEEREKEITSLKSSVPMFANNNSNDNPHILHYAHELARKDVEIHELRNNKLQLETVLFETRRETQVLAHDIQTHKQEIDRLKRSQSREGANMEYLKNVICNYFLTDDTSCKKHMFNAIAAVLMLNEHEIKQIKKHI